MKRLNDFLERYNVVKLLWAAVLLVLLYAITHKAIIGEYMMHKDYYENNYKQFHP